MKLLKFIALLVPVYFLISNVNVSEELVQNLLDQALVGIVFILSMALAIAIYYRMFTIAKGTLRTVGKILTKI